MKNYYQILGVPENAERTQIKKAYIMLAKRYHPDKLSVEEKANDIFADISEAYAVLSDDKKRAEYDEKFNKFRKGEDVEKQQREEKSKKMFIRAKRKIKEGHVQESLELIEKINEFYKYSQTKPSAEFKSYYGYVLYLSGKRKKDAMIMMDNAISETMFNEEDILLNLAEVYFIEKDTVKAKDYLIRAAKLNPKNKRAIRMKMKYDAKKKSIFDIIFRRK